MTKAKKKEDTAWEYRTLSLYVPFWIDGTKKRLKCVACNKLIFMGRRPYHFQLCESCRELIFPLAVPQRIREKFLR